MEDGCVCTELDSFPKNKNLVVGIGDLGSRNCVDIRNDGFFSCHHISRRDCLLASGRRFLHHFHS